MCNVRRQIRILAVGLAVGFVTASQPGVSQEIGDKAKAPTRCVTFDHAGIPVVLPGGKVFLPEIEDDFKIHLYNGTTWSDCSRHDYSKVGERNWYAGDDQGRIWRFYTDLESDEIGASVYDPTTDRFLWGNPLKSVLDDPNLCPKSFVAGEGEFRVPVLGPEGFAAIVSEESIECRVKGKWLPQIHYFRSFLNGRAQLPGPCYLDDRGWLCAEEKNHVCALAPGASRFKPDFSLTGRYCDRTGDIGYWKGEIRHSVPFVDRLGITWAFADDGLVRSAFGHSSVVVPGPEAEPMELMGGITALYQDASDGIIVMDNELKAAHIKAARKQIETKASAEVQSSSVIVMHLASGGALKHAWRIDGGAWHPTDLSEVRTDVLLPGAHVLEVYAFDEQLNTASHPVRIALSVAGENSLAALVHMLLSGSSDQRHWAAKEIQKRGPEGRSAIEKAKEDNKADKSMWWLNELLHQVREPEKPEASSTVTAPTISQQMGALDLVSDFKTFIKDEGFAKSDEEAAVFDAGGEPCSGYHISTPKGDGLPDIAVFALAQRLLTDGSLKFGRGSGTSNKFTIMEFYNNLKVAERSLPMASPLVRRVVAIYSMDFSYQDWIFGVVKRDYAIDLADAKFVTEGDQSFGGEGNPDNDWFRNGDEWKAMLTFVPPDAPLDRKLERFVELAVKHELPGNENFHSLLD